ncbi:hypothetical protein EB796_017015 [Bugula neritina]|uniref:Uncharacterized protein n=1 Tax=Bugula neritina TaxID=10212 RepID=A0A7J7JFT6_BUGNE|nr:hypothetical protein EB796_017015 [Bugula neritina]
MNDTVNSVLDQADQLGLSIENAMIADTSQCSQVSSTQPRAKKETEKDKNRKKTEQVTQVEDSCPSLCKSIGFEEEEADDMPLSISQQSSTAPNKATFVVKHKTNWKCRAIFYARARYKGITFIDTSSTKPWDRPMKPKLKEWKTYIRWLKRLESVNSSICVKHRPKLIDKKQDIKEGDFLFLKDKTLISSSSIVISLLIFFIK